MLSYESCRHAMLLEISLASEGIDCHLYNSGSGLHYHVQSRHNPRKYQTQLTIRIPSSAWTESLANSIVRYGANQDEDSAYQLFLQIPGASIARKNPKTAIWQTDQKSGSDNCALECYNAYLKNALGEPAYTDFRRRLFIECQKQDHPSLVAEEKESFSAELDRKIAKRERKLRSLQGKLAPLRIRDQR